MKIALLDDSADFIEFAKTVIMKIDINRTKLDTFTQSSDLIHAAQDYSYDVLLVDYELGDKTGLELLNSEQIQTPYIILITMHRSLSIAKDCFKCDIFRYVTKDNFETEITEAIYDINHLLKRESNRFLTVTYKGEDLVLDLSDIIAVYSVAHYVYFMNEKDSLAVRLSLNDIKSQLIENDFEYVKSNTLVNLHYIASIQKYKVILKNKQFFLISHSKYKNLYKHYLGVY